MQNSVKILHLVECSLCNGSGYDYQNGDRIQTGQIKIHTCIVCPAL